MEDSKNKVFESCVQKGEPWLWICHEPIYIKQCACLVWFLFDLNQSTTHNKFILMVKRLYDKHLLITLKKHSQFLKCGISKL